MSYLPPNPAILPDGQEVKVHGSEAFPFAVYCGIIPTFIPAYPLHYHEEMELIYCETGSGSITIDRATVTLHTGDVAVILPGQIHAIAAAGAGTFRYYNILFRFSLLEPPDSETYRRFLAPLADGRMEVPAHIQKDSPLGRELPVNVKMLIENRKENTALRIKACLYGVMDALCKAATPARHPAGAEHRDTRLLRQTVQYVDRHYAEKITVAAISAQCGYSSSHFMKRFHDLTGTSFAQYLIHFRLEKAATLLRGSRYTVLEIAARCGFSNAFYFTRAFTRQYGVSPTAYRQGGDKTDD